MPEPKFDDILDEEVELTDSESARIVCIADHARVNSAYWQGRCEGLELVIVQLNAAHVREIEAARDGFETTLSYLKDRLNRYEVGKEKADA